MVILLMFADDPITPADNRFSGRVMQEDYEMMQKIKSRDGDLQKMQKWVRGFALNTKIIDQKD